MAGRGEYIVSRSGQYKTVQDAIDALILDQGTTPFTETQSITILSDGVYKPYHIPYGRLVPTSTYRLEVKGQKGTFPTISGLATEEGYSGIIVETPYTTITQQIVRDCMRGIVFAETATSGQAGSLILSYNTNVGLFVYKAENFFGWNIIGHHSAFGVTGYQVKNFSLIHNVWACLPQQVQEAEACVFLVGKPEDSGTLLLRNNIMAAYSGRCFYGRDRDISAYDFDYNDYWAPSNKVAQFYGEKEIATLSKWRTRISDEEHGKFCDPLFVQTKTGRGFTAVWIDLKVLKNSDLVGAGEDSTVASGYPAAVDQTKPTYDILGNERSSTPTIGANEILLKSTYYGDSIFSEVAATDPCGYTNSLIDLAKEQYALGVTPWYPKVRSGFMFIRDHRYYLYSEKQGKTLDGITSSVVALSQRYIPTSLSVYVGEEELGDIYWNLRGDDLIIHHKDLELETNQEVRVSGEYLTWDSGEQTFTSSYASERHNLSDGETYYFLDPAPCDGAPIVITDQSIAPTEDTGHLPFGYDISYNEDYKLTELTFRQTNLLSNPQFEYENDDEVADWAVTGDITVSGEIVVLDDVHHPKIGHNYLHINNGEISQVISGFGTSSPHYLQVNAFPITGEVSITWDIEFYNVSGEYLDTYTGDELSVVTQGWHQSTMTAASIASGATQAVLNIGCAGRVGIEAVQLELDEYTSYNRTPSGSDMTIEWEGSNNGVYTISSLTLNPMTNPYTNGFLAIRNTRAKNLDGDADSSYRTLDDWFWQDGRLTYLPWAKCTGKNKWRPILREEVALLPESVGYTAPIPEPNDILVSPNPIIARQNSTGEEFIVRVWDTDRNPYCFEEVEADVYETTGEFPGYLAARQFGFYSNLGQKVNTETDTAGTVALRYIPMPSSVVEEHLPVPVSGYGPTGEVVKYITTKYEVSNINHGNPTFRLTSGANLALTDDLVSETRSGTQGSDGNYYISLSKYPSRSSITATIGSTRQVEIYTTPTDSGEFYVDYENKQVVLPIDSSLSLQYIPILAWKNPRYPRRIFIDPDLTIPAGSIFNHDAKIKFIATVASDNITKWVTADIICSNPYCTGEAIWD